ncbi:MAG: hypothetical protein JSV17_06170 [Candidatus Aminicenantes bacterium]|nr:MAG: hypothetical protein JSV17_06170 [Candidatus Aminicenantes bacterium]
MDSDRLEKREPDSPIITVELFSLLKKKQNITVRDDQYDFSTLLDAVRQFRGRRYRFRVIDTGRFDPFDLEWITGHGADLFTSDEARTQVHDLELISAASKRGNAFVSYLINRNWEDGGKDDLIFSDLLNVGRCGVYLHLTNRQQPRDIQQVARLAYNCAQGGSWLVYYHHGPLEESLMELGRNGAWIHMTDQSLEEEAGQDMVRDIVLSTRSSGSNVVLHWDGGNNFALLDDIVKAGAVVLFKSPLFDYKSPLKVLEKGIRRKRLDFRAYYLHPSVLP